jgi:hypothetical protein
MLTVAKLLNKGHSAPEYVQDTKNTNKNAAEIA